MTKRVLIVAGDPSGDSHAARLITEMFKSSPDLEFVTYGGKALENAGAELLANLVDDAVVGFSEVIVHLPRLYRVFQNALKTAETCDLVILVDYPGFNLRLARAIHKLARRPKTLWYIAPQVWAWHEERVPVMEKILDRIAVVFPFEEDIFSNARFVGHPLLELPDPMPPEGLESDKIVALLPGSRRKEVEKHVGILSEAAVRLEAAGMKPVMSVADPDMFELFRDVKCDLYSGDARGLVAAADSAIVKSGTSTLQTALTGTPFVTIYRLSPFSYMLGKRFVKTKWITMPNILLDSGVVPELIQENCTPDRIIETHANLERERQREAFATLTALLGGQGASKRTAELALELLD